MTNTPQYSKEYFTILIIIFAQHSTIQHPNIMPYFAFFCLKKCPSVSGD